LEFRAAITEGFVVANFDFLCGALRKSSAPSTVIPNIRDETAEAKTEGHAEKRREGRK
jgi:hypothetical protein